MLSRGALMARSALLSRDVLLSGTPIYRMATAAMQPLTTSHTRCYGVYGANARAGNTATNTASTAHRTSTVPSRHNDNRHHFNEISLRRNAEGGRQVFVTNNRVQEAYSQLRRICNDGQLQAHERRSQHYVKPKHRRQHRVDRMAEERRAERLREKVDVALELMRSGQY